MSADPRADIGDRSLPRLAVIGIAAAAGLVPLNSTMIAVALPEIANDFDISVGRVSALVTVYLIAMLIGQPTAGRITDRVGPRRAVTVALVGFAVFSVAATLASSFGLLVAARVAQAAFAAFLMPSVQSLLRSATPPEKRGAIFGMMGSILGVGAAMGPVVGGLLTEIIGWEAIFLVNLPIVALALVVVIRVGSDLDRSVHAAVSGPSKESPIVNRVFVAAFSTQALTTVAQYTLLLLTPVILSARGWESGSIGLVLSALTVGMIVFGPLGGRAGDRHGRRNPVLIGVGLAAGAVAVMLVAGASVDPAVLILALAFFGVGLGGSVPNFMTSALESVHETRTGSAAGVLSMSRYVGSITATVAFSAIVSSDASGTRSMLAISMAAMALAVVTALGLPGSTTTPAQPLSPRLGSDR